MTSTPAVDYAAFFTPRTLDHRRVVKPADCLVRYRYPFVCCLNDPALFPLPQWRECVHDLVADADLGTWATDYSALDDELLIEQLTQRVLIKRGIAARPDEVLVTLGGQQALYLAIKLLLTPGQTLGVEDPGYPDVVHMARSCWSHWHASSCCCCGWPLESREHEHSWPNLSNGTDTEALLRLVAPELARTVGRFGEELLGDVERVGANTAHKYLTVGGERRIPAELVAEIEMVPACCQKQPTPALSTVSSTHPGVADRPHGSIRQLPVSSACVVRPRALPHPASHFDAHIGPGAVFFHT